MSIAGCASFIDGRFLLRNGGAPPACDSNGAWGIAPLGGLPGQSDAGRFEIVADLRIDNSDELAAALGIAKRSPLVDSDELLLLAAWTRWGEESLRRIVGDFAIAVWDRHSRRLFLARDFSGQRPLHFRLGAGECEFASMPRMISGRSVPSLERIADFLGGVPEGPGPSFFEGIETIGPAEILSISTAGIERRTWWRPDTNPLHLTVGQAVEQASALLDQAVRACLKSSRPIIASQLSGGLDSSAVTAFAARALQQSGRRLLAVTGAPGGGAWTGSPNRFFDEARRASELAGRYSNIDHLVVRPRPASPFADLEHWHRLFDRPIGNYCNLRWVDDCYRAAAEAGADVMLIGLAGNFSISFDGRIGLAESIGRGRLLRWAKLAWRHHRQGGASVRDIVAQSFGAYAPPWVWRQATKWRRSMVIGSFDERNLLRPLHPLYGRMRAKADAREMDLHDRGERDSAGFRLRQLVRSDPGCINQGLKAKWGVETRDPTADRRLVEFCLRLPVEHYFDGRQTRLLARRMLADLAPKETISEERKGYQGADWRSAIELASGALRAEVAYIEQQPELAAILDHQTMRTMLDQWPAAGWNDERQIYAYRIKLPRAAVASHWLRTQGQQE